MLDVKNNNGPSSSRASRKSLKNNILTRKTDFQKAYAQGRRFFTDPFVMHYMPNALGHDRFGFTVSKRIGNAVLRNRVRRILKEVVRNSLVSGSSQNYDIILIARRGIEQTVYSELAETYRKYLRRLPR